MAIDLSRYISGIKIESAFLPPIDLPEPFKPGPPNPLLQLIKPRITLQTSLGEKVLTPYGDPGPSRWPQVKMALLLAGVGFLVYRLVR